VKISQI